MGLRALVCASGLHVIVGYMASRLGVCAQVSSQTGDERQKQDREQQTERKAAASIEKGKFRFKGLQLRAFICWVRLVVYTKKWLKSQPTR